MQTSVIIPCHNYGRFLREAIDSVRTQTVEDLEIIVVDDGSIDETQEVLARISDSEPRLRVASMKKIGYGAALNLGLNMARGEFIAFLDADDRWHANKLELQLSVMEGEPEVGAIFTDFSRFNKHGRYPKTQFSFFPELANIATRTARGPAAGIGRIIEGDAFSTLVSFGQFPAWLQTTLVRSSVVRDLRFPIRDNLQGIDLYYMLQTYRRAQTGFIAQPLVEVRRHGNNSYSGVESKLEGDLMTLLQIEKENALSEPHALALRKRIGRLLDSIGYYHFWSGNRNLAKQSYMWSLKYPGARWQSLKHLAALPAMPLLARREVSEWID